MNKSLKKPFFLSLVAAAFMATIATGELAAHAAIDPPEGDWVYYLKHYTPDTGYDPAIIYSCQDLDRSAPSTSRLLFEGEKSPCDPYWVFVRTNEEFWCYYYKHDEDAEYQGWYKAYDANGWHKNPGGGGWDKYGCTLRRD